MLPMGHWSVAACHPGPEYVVEFVEDFENPKLKETHGVYGETMAEAMGKMLIYLLEQKLITL